MIEEEQGREVLELCVALMPQRRYRCYRSCNGDSRSITAERRHNKRVLIYMI